MLQENQSALRDELLQTVKPDETLCREISNMGFDIELVRDALKATTNDMQKTIENLLRMQADGTYENAVKEILKHVGENLSVGLGADQPSTSTSTSTSTLTSNAVQDLADEMDVSSWTQFQYSKGLIKYTHLFNRHTIDLEKTLNMKIIRTWIYH